MTGNPVSTVTVNPATDPRGFAIWAHNGQLYGPGVPYVVHLDAVVEVIREFKDVLTELGPDAPSLAEFEAAGWLHDVPEDTTVSVEVIGMIFGLPVKNLVYGVTNEPGANRRERHEKTYPKTRHWAPAVFLKLCDRVANVRACVRTKDKRLGMYVKEHPAFRWALHRPGEFELLWSQLDAAFVHGE